jgi:hypothetical protein
VQQNAAAYAHSSPCASKHASGLLAAQRVHAQHLQQGACLHPSKSFTEVGVWLSCQEVRYRSYRSCAVVYQLDAAHGQLAVDIAFSCTTCMLCVCDILARCAGAMCTWLAGAARASLRLGGFIAFAEVELAVRARGLWRGGGGLAHAPPARALFTVLSHSDALLAVAPGFDIILRASLHARGAGRFAATWPACCTTSIGYELLPHRMVPRFRSHPCSDESPGTQKSGSLPQQH